MAREAKLAQGRSVDDNQEYFRWMVARGGSATVLAQLSEAPAQRSTAATLFEDGGSRHLAPKAEVLRSPALFTSYANCLVNEEKWTDLERLLRREGLPFTPAKIELMKAMCSQGMGAASAMVDDHLNAGLLYAAKTRSADDLAMVQAVAEKLDRQAIAVKACEVQAEDPAMRLDILKKEYSLQEDLRDADGMLKTALALTELRPGLRPYEERVHYLRLLTGQNLEDETRFMKEAVSVSGPQKTLDGAQWVTAALASYLMGDQEGTRLRLHMADLTGLPTGIRAVAAGLWAETGDPEKAFAIAERIMGPSTLLSEEQWFLKQALK